MVSMKTHFCTGWSLAALDAHFERPLATNAKFKFALGAGEVHAATFGQGISKFAIWALNSMFL